MKKVLLLIIGSMQIYMLYSQSKNPIAAVCLPNGNFVQYTNPPNNNLINGSSCSYFSNATVPYWYVSHGSPQFTGPSVTAFYTTIPATSDPSPVYNPNPAYNSIYMWSGVVGALGLQGEGIVTDYAFSINTGYAITVNAIFSGGDGSSNSANTYFNVLLANGVPQDPGASNCGTAIPSALNTQTVAQIPASGTNQITVSQTYAISAKNSTYSQLWIYPYSALNEQCNLNIYSVDICYDCSSTVYYNTGVVPINYSKFGSIYAGSTSGSGGSGTVTISAAATTTFIASNAVYLEPNFTASTSGNGVFIAKITPCQNSGSTSSTPTVATQISNNVASNSMFLSARQTNGNIASKLINVGKHQLVDSLAFTRQMTDTFEKVTIYPNPAKDIINIDFISPETGQAYIKITNAVGQIVAQTYKHIDDKSVLQHQAIKLSQLASGIYFIKITSKSVMHVDKFVKN